MSLVIASVEDSKCWGIVSGAWFWMLRIASEAWQYALWIASGAKKQMLGIASVEYSNWGRIVSVRMISESAL